MSRMLKVAVGIGVLTIAAGRGSAQGLVTQKSLSLGMAKTIAEAAQSECRAKGYHTTVAVVDRAGQLLVLLRDEQAGPHTVEMARRKAYTARIFRSTTAEFQRRTTPDQPIAGQRDLTDVLALSGGVPIKLGDETIGAVGSAGSTLESDDACAKAGIAKVADQLK
ncbi:MAG TPA: heme-binding protein [Bryobacteraceae bacterium]|nr:heme-binding protein [Bryobacteraceae bacterium]